MILVIIPSLNKFESNVLIKNRNKNTGALLMKYLCYKDKRIGLEDDRFRFTLAE